MKNELEKWRGEDSRLSPVSDERRAMDEALRKLRQCGGPETDTGGGSGTHGPQRDAPGEIVLQECVCARHDLPFITKYVRQANGRFRAVESIRISAGKSGSDGCGNAARLSVNEIDGDQPCAWCGTNSGHYHCDCGGVVCGGKVRGKTFHCRASCGESWTIGTPVTEIEVSHQRTERQEWKAPPPRASSWAAPARNAGRETGNRFLLGPGGQPPTR